jgi:predicted lipoprotein with Yx(FWY)xxD motif
VKRTLGTVALCVTLSGTIVACSGDEGSNGTSASNASDGAREVKQSSSRSSGKGVVVKVRNSRYGRMLFDRRNRALYLFTRERTSRSRCYGDCAKAWPPFLTKGSPRARGGAKSSLLGTTRRRDGKLQVTYHGRPLYYYVDDGPGQVLCQDVVEFGGTWLVVSPSGAAIR